MSKNTINQFKPGEWLFNNIVTLLFVAFTLFGFAVSKDVSLNFFLNELSERVFRNAFLVLSLIIPVVAGLGLNFGIVVGAMAGQIALVIVRYCSYYYDIGGVKGFLLCMLISMPIGALFGYFTGRLYNKTRGQEMIASLIVGYFANGLYQLLFLFVVGKIIIVDKLNPLIIPDGVGIRMTVDLLPVEDGGLKYALDNIFKVNFVTGVLIISLCIMAFVIIKFIRAIKNPSAPPPNKLKFGINLGACVAIAAICAHAMATRSSLLVVRKIPVVTVAVIILLCVFTELMLKTKLGQDFRSVGQSQSIAKVSGINVDKTRIIAVMMSTVLASWGMLIYLQNMGTLNTYNAHTQIGMFSVAALLVGGASTKKANIKHAILGTILFNSMFIMSPEIGQALFGLALLGEYFRTFMVYGVIALALGLYIWKDLRSSKPTLDS